LKQFSTLPRDVIKSIISASILTITILPILLILNSDSHQWVLKATLIWAVGSMVVFHPFIKYIFPHLLSKLSLYLLTSILIIVSAWLNIVIITYLLPYDTLYYELFETTLTHISLLGTLYVFITNAIISSFVLASSVEFYEVEKIF
jgi:hypothetical protein